MKVDFSPAALAQFREAQAYYREIGSPVARRFATEVRRSVRQLSRNPRLGRRIAEFRRLILRGFPYLVLYYIGDKGVTITSLAHQKREPDRRDDQGLA